MLYPGRKTIGIFLCKTSTGSETALLTALDRESGRMNTDVVVFLSAGDFRMPGKYDLQEKNILKFVPLEKLDGIIAAPDTYAEGEFRDLVKETFGRLSCPVVMLREEADGQSAAIRAMEQLNRQLGGTARLPGEPVAGEGCEDFPPPAEDDSSLTGSLASRQGMAISNLCSDLGACADLADLHRAMIGPRTENPIVRDHYLCLFGTADRLMEEAGSEMCLVHAVYDHRDGGMPMIVYDRASLLPPVAWRNEEAQVFYVKLLHQGGHHFGFSIVRYDHGQIPSRYFGQTNVLLSNALESIRRQQKLMKLYEERRLSSITDHMTGLLNRRGLLESVEPLWRTLTGTEIAFICIDMDYLKHTNDTFGHAAGDVAICLIGRAIRKSLPEGAMGARTGGDEFIVFLPDAGQDRASQFVHRFQTVLNEITQEEKRSFTVSASAGFKVVRPDADTTADECIRASDRILYQIKENRPNKMIRSGWNRWQVQQMPVPFGTASDSLPYYAEPCDERISVLPEALMKLADDGYSWEYAYIKGKPDYALTLMDYSNIYSFIHTHSLDGNAVRRVLSDAGLMVHRRAFTEEEIDLLLGGDQAKAMAYFASPSTIVMGEKGYSEKWMYDHAASTWRQEGIKPGMVIPALPHYYNPLFVQKAADAFSLKLYQYTGMVTPVKWNQWKAGDIRPDGSVEEGKPAGKGVMLDVMEFCQYSDYPTGCECVSLYMLLSYYGVKVSMDQICDLLPMGAQPYDHTDGNRYGANPEREFVGDPRKEISYGVFNGPVAWVAEQIRPGVKTKTGATMEEIKAILDTGNPVLAWYLSAPMRPVMYRWSWLDDRGETVFWPGGEHAVVISGYDDTGLIYRDPNAGTTVEIDDGTFEKGFTQMGGRIIYYEK